MKLVPDHSQSRPGSRKKVCITDYLTPQPLPSFKDRDEFLTAPSSLEEVENRQEESQTFSQARERTDFDIFQFLHENINAENDPLEALKKPTDDLSAQICLRDIYRMQREVKCFCTATTLDQPNALKKARSDNLFRFYQYSCSDNDHDENNALAISSLLQEFDYNEKNEFHFSMSTLEALGLRSHEKAAELAGVSLTELEKRNKYVILWMKDKESLITQKIMELDIVTRILSAPEKGVRILISGAVVFFVMQIIFELTFTGTFCNFVITSNFSFFEAKMQQATWEVTYLPHDAVVSGEFLNYAGKAKEKFHVEPEELAPKAIQHMEEFEEYLDKYFIILRPGLFGRLLENHLKFIFTNTKNPQFMLSC